MTPVDFVLFDGDSSPNTPVYVIAEAMKRSILVHSAGGEHEILSYYYDHVLKQFVLDIA
jgi:hypothetical protein